MIHYFQMIQSMSLVPQKKLPLSVKRLTAREEENNYYINIRVLEEEGMSLQSIIGATTKFECKQ